MHLISRRENLENNLEVLNLHTAYCFALLGLLSVAIEIKFYGAGGTRYPHGKYGMN